MRKVILCSFLISLAWALPKNQEELQYKKIYVDPITDQFPQDVLPRIVNGREAVPHSIPYQAYLIVTGQAGRWLCGGSLISPRHVLTAGHCVDDAISALVYLGAHNLQTPEAGRIIVQSHHLIRHENYNETDISNDIGIIVLDQPVELNEYIDIVMLPSREITDNYKGVNARVSGWGRVAGDQGTSPVLLEVNSTVIDNYECNLIYGIVIDSQLCISGAGGVGSCRGDSGGPLVYGSIQIGVVSYGAKDCPPGYPSAFTRVTSYLDWIVEHTGLNL